MNNEEKIKVRDLPDASSLQTSDKLMILTDTVGNYVKNIAVSDFNANNISTDSLNYIMIGTDGKLFSLDPQTITGYLNNLNTNEKSNIVAAVNEVNNAAHSADFNNVVHKTGNETIAGDKVFSNNITVNTGNYPTLFVKNDNLNWSINPQDYTQSGRVGFLDLYDVLTGDIHAQASPNGDRLISVGVNNKSNTQWAYIQIGFTQNNAIYTYCPPCDFINSILTTIGIQKGLYGYLKLGNGIILQWGYFVGSIGTITLPTAFSTTDYIIVTTQRSSDIGAPATCSTYNFTATTFEYNTSRQSGQQAVQFNTTWQYIAMGI